MSKNKEMRILFLLTLIILLLYLIFDFLSTGTLGEDDIQHFLIAKYSWLNPKLFLHLFGKTLFLLLLSPFAQFGLIGARIFNSISAILSCIVTYLVAKKLKINNSLFSPIFLAFIPYFFFSALNNSAHVLASLFLVSAIYFYLKEKYEISAFLISALTQISAEFLLFIFLWVFLLAKEKKFVSIPLLFLFPLLIIIPNLSWFWYNNPYFGLNALRYQVASPYIFIKNIIIAFGPIALILLFFGFYLSFKKFNILHVCLIFYFLIYFLVWYYGIIFPYHVTPLVTIAPIVAIFANNALNSLFMKINKNLTIPLTILIIFLMVLQYNYLSIKIPVPLNEEQKVVKKASDWFVNSNYTDRRIYNDYPFFAYSANINPFSTDVLRTKDMLENKPEKKPKSGDIIVCDTHFCLGDYKIPLNYFEKGYNLIKTFQSKRINFKVLIFERI